MYAFSAVISLALAIAATAAPAKRAVSCQPSSSVLANVTKFTMTAFTADGNGVLNGSWPLTIGPATKSGGLDVLASVDSFPGAAPSDFTMHNSAIATLASDGATTVEWDNNITGDPSFLSFSPASKPAANAEIYCASVSTSAHGNPNIPWVILLQLNNDSTRFSLCKTLNGLNAVIYGNPQLASKSSGIVTSSCISNVGIGIKEI